MKAGKIILFLILNYVNLKLENLEIEYRESQEFLLSVEENKIEKEIFQENINQIALNHIKLDDQTLLKLAII